MKKLVMITTAALLTMGASGAYAQSTHHHWKHARERIAPYSDSMAATPGGYYRSFPGAVGDEGGDDANSMSGPNSAGSNAEGRTAG